ncbi:hypothetical protein D7V82_21560 [bacterium 1xD8-6]|nr:hypothetical protein D7V72_22060 [bacterium D16-36]RKI62575.1 hypothetical protein D7V82_21560 [bacterium 1xD8-6]
MDNTLLDRLMKIAITGLFLAGMIFICICLFSNKKTTHYYFLLYSVMSLQVYSILSEILIKSKYCIIRIKGRLWICLS